MTDTRTLILWPTRLKIGAKSKKGTCIVDIFGLPEIKIILCLIIGNLPCNTLEILYRLWINLKWLL